MEDPLLKLAYLTTFSYFQNGELAKALGMTDQLLSAAADQALVDYLMCAELACGIYLEADQDKKAEKIYRDIIRRLDPVLKEAPGELAVEMLLSSCYAGLGRCYFRTLHYDQSISWFSKRYALTRQWLDTLTEENMPLPVREHFHAISCEQFCQLYNQKEDAAEALSYGLEFNTIMKELYRKDPANATLVFSLITSYIHLGRAYMLNKDKENSAATLIAGLALSDEYSEEFSDNYEHSGPLLVLLEALGEFYATEQEYEKALPYFLRQYTVINKLSQLNKDTMATKFNIGCAASKLADSYVHLQKLPEALPYLKQMEQIFTELIHSPEAHLSHYHNLYFCHATYVEYHQTLGNLSQAIQSATRTVDILKKMFDMTKGERRYRNLLGKHYKILAKLYREQNEEAKARECDAKVDWLIRPYVSNSTFFRLMLRHAIYRVFKV